MEEPYIKPGVVYLNKRSGRLGVLFTEVDYGCLGDEEVGIVYCGSDNNPEENNSFFTGTKPDDLEIYLLKPEDMLTKKHLENTCQFGKGKSCCRYLIFSDEKGFSCERISGNPSMAQEINKKVREGIMNSKGSNCGERYGTVKTIN